MNVEKPEFDANRPAASARTMVDWAGDSLERQNYLMREARHSPELAKELASSSFAHGPWNRKHVRPPAWETSQEEPASAPIRYNGALLAKMEAPVLPGQAILVSQSDPAWQDGSQSVRTAPQTPARFVQYGKKDWIQDVGRDFEVHKQALLQQYSAVPGVTVRQQGRSLFVLRGKTVVTAICDHRDEREKTRDHTAELRESRLHAAALSANESGPRLEAADSLQHENAQILCASQVEGFSGQSRQAREKAFILAATEPKSAQEIKQDFMSAERHRVMADHPVYRPMAQALAKLKAQGAIPDATRAFNAIIATNTAKFLEKLAIAQLNVNEPDAHLELIAVAQKSVKADELARLTARATPPRSNSPTAQKWLAHSYQARLERDSEFAAQSPQQRAATVLKALRLEAKLQQDYPERSAESIAELARGTERLTELAAEARAGFEQSVGGYEKAAEMAANSTRTSFAECVRQPATAREMSAAAEVVSGRTQDTFLTRAIAPEHSEEHNHEQTNEQTRG